MADKDQKQDQKQEKAKRPEKGGAKGAAEARAQTGPAPAQAGTAPARPEPKTPARLRLRYESEIVPLLMRELKIGSRLRTPRLEKIVVNLGLGEARENPKLLEAAAEELKQIAGQKPVMTRARKAISNFKLREGMPIGVMVTLRRERMWEFFDRLVNVALPRVRDFRGVSDKAFDGRGDYSLGIREHTIFAELNLDKVEKVKGLTVTFVTTARSDFEALALLKALGMPFKSMGEGRTAVAAA